jgi:hypothetical protein
LRTDNWDAFEEEVREAGRPVRLVRLDTDVGELQTGRRILSENDLLVEDDESGASR